MEEILHIVASYAATLIEAAAILTVLIGAAEALVRMAGRLLPGVGTPWTRRAIWIRFAGWIVIALEFTLGADIVRTAIAPSWDDIGKLAAIAAIRTALNFFLERDIEEALETSPVGA